MKKHTISLETLKKKKTFFKVLKNKFLRGSWEERIMNEKVILQFLKKQNVYAVVGASRDPEKFGHHVFKDLRKAGYQVYCINPKANEVLGDKCYPSLEVLPSKPDVVNLVVPPQITEKIVKECKKLKIRKVWMQPGSESKAAIKFCEENGIEVIHGMCVMIERKRQE